MSLIAPYRGRRSCISYRVSGSYISYQCIFRKYNIFSLDLYQCRFLKIQYTFFILYPSKLDPIQNFWIVSVVSRSNTKMLYRIKLSDTFLIQITDIYQKYRPDPRKIRFGSEDLRKLVGRVGRPLYGAAESESLRRHRTHPRPKESNPTKYKRDNQTLFNEFS